MKEIYISPELKTVKVQQRQFLCNSQIQGVTGNAGLTGGNSDAGYEGDVRGRSDDFDW